MDTLNLSNDKVNENLKKIVKTFLPEIKKEATINDTNLEILLTMMTDEIRRTLQSEYRNRAFAVANSFQKD